MWQIKIFKSKLQAVCRSLSTSHQRVRRLYWNSDKGFTKLVSLCWLWWLSLTFQSLFCSFLSFCFGRANVELQSLRLRWSANPINNRKPTGLNRWKGAMEEETHYTDGLPRVRAEPPKLDLGFLLDKSGISKIIQIVSFRSFVCIDLKRMVT